MDAPAGARAMDLEDLLDALIPQPLEVEVCDGVFTLDAGLVIAVSDPSLKDLAVLLQQIVYSATGVAPNVVASADGPVRSSAILLEVDEPRYRVDDFDLAAESYVLESRESSVLIRGATPAGVSRGIATFRQLLPPSSLRVVAVDRGAGVTVPCVTIADRPRLAWRGVMIDTVRTFQPKRSLLSLVDWAWQYKYNVLHLHLTDDQGWRIDIPSRPRLSTVASWRAETVKGHYFDALAKTADGTPRREVYDGTPHGGVYTLDDLREIVAYAAVRGIVVIPEIDLPGHATSAIAAYPELGSGGHLETATDFGVLPHLLEPTPAALDFTAEVFRVLATVFDGRYVHIGGDEVETGQWESSAVAQEVVAAEGFESTHDVQGWFTRRLVEQLALLDRQAVGWDDMAKAAVPHGTPIIVGLYLGTSQRLKAALDQGLRLIMSPHALAYFDHYESDLDSEPLRINGKCSVEDIACWDPVPDYLDDSDVLGTQCLLWTEYLRDQRDLEYAAFPRLGAFAEASWSSMGARSRRDLLGAVAGGESDRLTSEGVNFRPLSGPRPWQRGGSGLKRRYRGENTDVIVLA